MPNNTLKKQTRHIRVRLDDGQRDALERVAVERDTTATALVREFIESLTGVPTTVGASRYRDGRSGLKAKT